jgi:hypothetical protein
VSVRRIAAYAGLTFSLSTLAFSMGSWTAQQSMAQQIADNDARLSALQDNLARGILRSRESAVVPSGTDGQRQPEIVPAGGEAQSALIDEIKRQLQSEMGLMPVRLLRERRDSFVELNAVDNFGKTSYGTAGYLGDANVEVHSGDWAIIRVRGKVNLPALRIDTGYNYDFAEPIFRLGNDYSKGIILSTGYVGQRTPNGLVTCLTDGHPGVSGGGVLNQQGDLVGIPIGRMQGDYRFSFILPVRSEMFRKIPGLSPSTADAE